ncbi:MAG: hypothetical protein KDC71_19330 [Acidobacteria bacterium]|nr:hypothetical protein [Acidobacteriota bacterium]
MLGRYVPRHELRPNTISAMYRLFERHFDGPTEGQFLDDLDQKTGALLIEDNYGQVMGFSTLLFRTLDYQNEPIAMVYSGDTIMDPSAWNSPILARLWIRSVLDLHSQCPDLRLFWLLISSGLRTYRFLPTFWQNFYPHPHKDQIEMRDMAFYLAQQLFPFAFQPETGLVHFYRPQMLKPHLQVVPERLLQDPFVQHFLERNPNHLQGDELVCLTEITEQNLTRAGWRMIQSGPPSQHRASMGA